MVIGFRNMVVIGHLSKHWLDVIIRHFGLGEQ